MKNTSLFSVNAGLTMHQKKNQIVILKKKKKKKKKDLFL